MFADKRSNRYLRPLLEGRKAWVYRGFAVLWLIVTVFFWHWWLQSKNISSVTLFIVATVPLMWIYLLQAYFLWVMLGARVPASPAPAPGRYRVAMVTTKTPSEPFAIVRRTLEAMLAQDYPHDTWLADEDPSEDTLAWCAAHGVKVSTRKGRADYHRAEWPRRTRCKEGNLAFFYDHWGYWDYDIVSQLDSDHVPQPGYLIEMLRPFDDYGVGYVSAPSICSANARDSWAARTRLYVESAFHGALQTGYTGKLAPMCIGSHYAVRTFALRTSGGLGPELAEDHSTTMLMNAAGWKGVHAVDAIAYGDGPATVSDLATQEFQWSRSLLSLLLWHTSRYLSGMSFRLRFLFVFCQLWYLIFALTTALMYALPLLALALDRSFANVSYPAFVVHALPTILVMTFFVFRIRRDGLLRPYDSPVISWEKALFLLLQWPWVLWGITMAVVDRLRGGFVDFRITPKGENAVRSLPWRVLLVYIGLALGCLLPVLLLDGSTEAAGFYLLTLLNGVAYSVLVAVIVFQHLRTNGFFRGARVGNAFLQLTAVAGLFAVMIGGFMARGNEGLGALSAGMGPFHLMQREYVVSGAGSGDQKSISYRFDPGWN